MDDLAGVITGLGALHCSGRADEINDAARSALVHARESAAAVQALHELLGSWMRDVRG
ncbi:hypothetical protein [Catenuloplanes atrovinosus]|uniref:Uncharacterized protein n=1 Tax=Catenuloplanes atrovinosus TaxID=137266 RepID=A0AAE3YQ24_9ACTN|nr:hypothetical protein [Catenuloplanes atrovinosus]MDR7277580.1 hypothetical protein [Catenuloplanes atrovinosus]